MPSPRQLITLIARGTALPPQIRFRPSHMASQSADINAYPFYSPRFWHGMGPKAWWRLLRCGDFAVSPSRLPMAIGVTLATPVNLVLGAIERIVFHRRIRRAELHGPPVFIIGHW
ncbi:MAG: hypothetical protein AAF745_19235, partial [Planctomycetota bacterium]